MARAKSTTPPPEQAGAQNTSSAKILLSVPDGSPTGKETLVSLEELERLLSQGVHPVSFTISVEEGRQRAQYQGVKKFLSISQDLSTFWEILASIQDPEMALTMRRRAPQFLEAAVARTYQFATDCMSHELLKDGLQVYPRGKSVWTDNPISFKDALKANGGRVP